MFHHSQEPIRDEEVNRLKRNRGLSILGRLFGKAETQHDAEHAEQRSVDMYYASVSQCFIPSNFNEELPLYLLDLDGMILVLFGQWMFDPHTLIARKEVFEAWNCSEAFFGSFSLRCLAATGTVFQLAVEGTAFVEAQQLSSVLRFKRLGECQLVAGHGATLIRDLEKGGLIETV